MINITCFFFSSRRRHTRSKRDWSSDVCSSDLHVFAQGILHVTGEGEVVIDEVLPADKSLLKDPEAYITVQFDPNQPAPPPCPGGLPDEVDWELFFTHVHDVG